LKFNRLNNQFLKVAKFCIIVFAFLLFAGKAQAAIPVISFSANDSVLPVGDSTVLNWNVTDAVSCQASGAWTGNKALSGTFNTGSLFGDTTFVLDCTGSAGESASAQVDIIVADPPNIIFTSDNTSIPYNSSANLSWVVTGANTCTALEDWSGTKPLSGTYNTGNLISSKKYKLSCEGVGGISESEIQINIESPYTAPELDFSAGSYYVAYDEATDLQWSSSNADICIGTGDWSGTKSLAGSENTGNLQDNMNYILTCSGTGGSIARVVNIIVGPRPVDPPELTFTADDYDVDYGTGTTLRWSAADVNSCSALGTFGWSKPASGTYNTGALYSNKTYSLRCEGDGGTVRQDLTINVGPNPNPAPTLNFSAQDDPIPYNGSTVLNWTTSNATSCTSSGAWGTSSRPTSGSYDTGTLTADKTYGLSCSGLGGTVSQNITITVGDPVNPPDVDFWADDYDISYNSRTTLRWTSEDANWCTLRYDSANVGVSLDGSYSTGNLIDDTVFTLSCGNSAGTTTKALTINVSMTGPPPEINLWADENPIDYGSSTTVRWTTEYADSCVMIGISSVPVNGSMGTGTLYSPKTYTMQCLGPGGVSQESITIGIRAGTIPTDPPDLLFWADSYNLLEGEDTDLHWIANNADWCDASLGWSGNKPTSGDENTGPLEQTTSYRITCGNIQGETSSTLTINVGNLPDVKLDFWADSYNVSDNGSTTLRWESTNATVCYTLGGNWGWYNYKDLAGSENTGTLWNYSNDFILQCRNFLSSDTKSVTIYAGDPPPSISFYAASTTIGYNTPAYLFWDSWNTTYCRAWSNNSEENIWNGNLETSGTRRTSNLTSNTRFYLRCYGPGGTVTRSIRVRVSSAGATLPSLNFSAADYLLPEGNSTTVSWASQNASGCRAFSDPTVSNWSGNKDRNGSQAVGPIGEETDLYIVCWNGSGSSSAMLTIRTGSGTVLKPSLSFWSDTSSLMAGDSTRLHWQALNADNCVASGDWSGTKNTGTGSENTGALNANKHYELTCSNDGGSISGVVDIFVGGALPPPVLSFDTNGEFDYEAGDPIELNWSCSNGTRLIASGYPDQWSGDLSYFSGQETITAEYSTTLTLRCEGYGGQFDEVSHPIWVAKVIVCPQNIQMNKDQTRQLNAYYMQNATVDFSCDNAALIEQYITEGKAANVTDGFGGFPTDWESEDDSLIELQATPGLIKALNYTIGYVNVCADYKETTGCTKVQVALTCWRCNSDGSCSAEPVGGDSCPEQLFSDRNTCIQLCGLKWGNWKEVAP